MARLALSSRRARSPLSAFLACMLAVQASALVAWRTYLRNKPNHSKLIRSLPGSSAIDRASHFLSIPLSMIIMTLVRLIPSNRRQFFCGRASCGGSVLISTTSLAAHSRFPGRVVLPNRRNQSFLKRNNMITESIAYLPGCIVLSHAHGRS